MLKQSPDLFDFVDLDGPQLDSFFKYPPQPLFPKATHLPLFFNYNLVSPQREVLQIENNLDGRLRVFYYQLFKVCFQLELEKSARILNHLQFMIFNRTDGNQDQTTLNTKKIIAQWVLKLMNEHCAQCHTSICSYPVLNGIFCAFLTEVLRQRRQTSPEEISIDEVFGQLADEFQLSVVNYGNCFRFQDSDVFCYIQDSWLYLAYMNSSFMEESSGRMPMLDVIIERENSEQGTKHNLSNSKILSITNLNMHRPSHRRTTSIEESCEQTTSQPLNCMNQPFNVQISDFQLASLDRSFQSLKQQLQDRMISTKTNTFRSTLTEVKDELEVQNEVKATEISKGDFYEDFTSTFILQAMGQPFKSSIREIKNKVRGVRRAIQPVFRT